MNILKGILIFCIIIVIFVLLYQIFIEEPKPITTSTETPTGTSTGTSAGTSTTQKTNQNKDYAIMENTVVKDYTYYRLGAKTESELNNTLYIQSIINSIIQIIKNADIKNNLLRNKPIFLIGSSARNFDEF
jgi:hypothetical protein